MKIGIIVAMRKELDLLLEIIKNKTEETSNGYDIYSGTIGNHQVFAMQCGIGKVNAAIGTMSLIDKYCPEMIINTGVAGGANKNIRQMDIVVGEKIAYHDVWCGPGTPYGEASGYPLFFNSSQDILNLLKHINANENENIIFGLICSGDKFIASEQEVEEIASKFPEVSAVDMESASIAQVCYLKKVPVFVMRVISDTPGSNNDNTSQYENFWESAPKHTFATLTKILTKL